MYYKTTFLLYLPSFSTYRRTFIVSFKSFEFFFPQHLYIVHSIYFFCKLHPKSCNHLGIIEVIKFHYTIIIVGNLLLQTSFRPHVVCEMVVSDLLLLSTHTHTLIVYTFKYTYNYLHMYVYVYVCVCVFVKCSIN